MSRLPKLAAGVVLSGVFLACGGGGGSSAGGGSNPPPPPDTVAPTVLTTNPAPGAIEVQVNVGAVDIAVSANFSEALSDAIPGGAFTLATGGESVPGVAQFSGSTATFKPAARLTTGRTFTATLGTAIKDGAGNPLAQPYVWTFTTRDCISLGSMRQLELGPAASSTTGAEKCLATDGAALYVYWQDMGPVSGLGTVLKVDPATGQIQATHTIPLIPQNALTTPIPQGIVSIENIVWHGGALWAGGDYYVGTSPGSRTQGVFRLNLSKGLVESAIPLSPGLPGEVPILQGLASDGTNLFAAIDRNYPLPTAAEHVIVSFNPSGATTLPFSPVLARTSGQMTRLAYGGGYLWGLVNPNFQKFDPATGQVLSNHCMDASGGRNLAWLEGVAWTMKGTLLQGYRIH